MASILTRILSLAHLFYAYLLMVQTKAHPHSTTILGEPGSPKRDVGPYYNGKEGRKEVSMMMIMMVVGMVAPLHGNWIINYSLGKARVFTVFR